LQDHKLGHTGNINVAGNHDFVYWLNQHMMQNFGISLESLVGDVSQLAGRQEHLWPWTKAAMSYMFRYIVDYQIK
jgi:hypothetical protein